MSHAPRSWSCLLLEQRTFVRKILHKILQKLAPLLLILWIYFTVSVLVVVMRELHVTQIDGKSLKLLRTPFYLPLEYRCVQLIHKQLMQIAGLLLGFLHSVLGHFILFCNYSILKQWDVIDSYTKVGGNKWRIQSVNYNWYIFLIQGMLGTWSILMQIMWGIILQLSGGVYPMVRDTLDSWKFMTCRNVLDKKYMSKFRKSCRPFVVGEEGVFVIKQLSVLKFFRSVVKGTFKALLTLGKKKWGN